VTDGAQSTTKSAFGDMGVDIGDIGRRRLMVCRKRDQPLDANTRAAQHKEAS
jgi:hypothetical protein